MSKWLTQSSKVLAWPLEQAHQNNSKLWCIIGIVFTRPSSTLLTEFGFHHRLESCVSHSSKSSIHFKTACKQSENWIKNFIIGLKFCAKLKYFYVPNLLLGYPECVPKRTGCWLKFPDKAYRKSFLLDLLIWFLFLFYIVLCCLQ